MKSFTVLFVYMLAAAIALTTWTSCREVDRMSGSGDGSGNGSSGTGEILRGCHYGWTENADTGECECLSPNVIIGDYECRPVEADYWYSDMAGCLVDQGIRFKMQGPIHPDSVQAFSLKNIFVELPDSNRIRPNIHPGSLRILRRGERFDSVQLYVPSSANLPYHKWFEYNTGFHGIILNDSTLVGQFVFGPMANSWEIDRNLIFSECEAIIRKGRVE
jgi:hypothetical protein